MYTLYNLNVKESDCRCLITDLNESKKVDVLI